MFRRIEILVEILQSLLLLRSKLLLLGNCRSRLLIDSAGLEILLSLTYAKDAGELRHSLGWIKGLNLRSYWGNLVGHLRTSKRPGVTGIGIGRGADSGHS